MKTSNIQNKMTIKKIKVPHIEDIYSSYNKARADKKYKKAKRLNDCLYKFEYDMCLVFVREKSRCLEKGISPNPKLDEVIENEYKTLENLLKEGIELVSLENKSK
jgi:hypothetical protein